MEKKSEKPFGSYFLPLWAQALCAFCHKIPLNYFGRRLVFILRKPVLWFNRPPIDISINGARFRLLPDMNLSDKRLLCTPDLLDGAERKYINENLPLNNWLVDIGANIGGYSLLVASSRKDIKVVAVEADPEMVKRLNDNILFSEMADRVHSFWGAATEQSSPVFLKRDDKNRGKNEVVNESQAKNSLEKIIQVQGYSLLDLLNRFEIVQPGVVKLDIEGYEFHVLKGFFANAPKKRWPHYIQLEQYRKSDLNDAVLLVMENGYNIVKKTRMNVILAKIKN